MRAVVVEQYGGPEVLIPADRPEPVPGDGQVSIEVAYAGINYADVMARRDGYQVAALPFVPGLEVSGTVRALGPGVAGLQVGEPVAAFILSGGYAEVVVADAHSVHALPPQTELRAAATWLTVLPTAHAVLHEVGRLAAGESVLVHSAAGGVGTAIGQLARAAGASAVYGVVSSPAKVAYALGQGYDRIFVGDEFAVAVPEATGGRGVDLILDPIGGDTLRANLGLLARFGRVVSFGNAGTQEPWRWARPNCIRAHRACTGSPTARRPARTRRCSGRSRSTRCKRRSRQGSSSRSPPSSHSTTRHRRIACWNPAARPGSWSSASQARAFDGRPARPVTRAAGIRARPSVPPRSRCRRCR